MGRTMKSVAHALDNLMSVQSDAPMVVAFERRISLACGYGAMAGAILALMWWAGRGL
ncbi:MAG: hypothetical protein ACKOUM_04125 [Sphingopyxis sp.]